MSHNGHDRILVVDDQPEVRQAAVRLLKALGHITVEADQASAALEILEQDDHFDLLFTDIVMPGGMSGWDLADRTRQIRAGLPVVFTSGYALEALVEKGHDSAQSILLTKPYRKAELAQRIREAMMARAPVS